ncbi:MAG: NAD-dependent epimerase/dehydratase family protein, partial [Candidatus Binatia bacterium]
SRLGTDVARALAATGAFARVATAGTMPPAVRNRHRRIDFLDRGAPRRLAAVLADVAPDAVVQLALSESPVTPVREGHHDVAVAATVSTGIRLLRERGGEVRRMVALSSTAVYGLARSSPLLFDERDTSAAGAGADPRFEGGEVDTASLYGRWVRDLREYEAVLAKLAEDTGMRLAVLRAAYISGGPVSNPITEYLAAPLPVRVLGHDPPVQVVHYDDLVETILRAAEEPVSGTINVVARGAVPVTRLGALAGRYMLPLPHALARLVAPEVLGAAPLCSRCVADGSRAVQLLGIQPRRSAEEALGG